MIDLDDINAYSEYDLENMIGHLTNIPELIPHGMAQGNDNRATRGLC